MVEEKFASSQHHGIQEDIQAIYDLAQDCNKVGFACMAVLPWVSLRV